MPVDVLMVDDEVELGDATVEYLTTFGITATHVTCAEDALGLLESDGARLILLDINLPGMSGFEFCREVRARHTVPILFISARGGDDDQVLALGMGGDDYITKPYSLAVLLAKVRRALDRVAAGDEEPPDFDDGHLHVAATGRTYVDGVELHLPTMEDRLLRYLVANRGRVVTKQNIFDHVWEEPFTSDGTLTVHVRRLRSKIEPDPDHPAYLKTIWGRGYIFDGAAG